MRQNRTFTERRKDDFQLQRSAIVSAASCPRGHDHLRLI